MEFLRMNISKITNLQNFRFQMLFLEENVKLAKKAFNVKSTVFKEQKPLLIRKKDQVLKRKIRREKEDFLCKFQRGQKLIKIRDRANFLKNEIFAFYI